MSNQIKNSKARAVIVTAQQGAVSTQDVVEHFMPLELYNKIYRGWGSGKQPAAMHLTAEEANQVSFALAAMANTFLDIAKDIPKQKK